MFKDGDLIGVTCPHCGEQTEKTIGWLKASADFHCPGCRTLLHHDPEHFARHVLEEAARSNSEIIINVTRVQK